jgi:myosin-crossreactive antigen
MKLKKFLKGKSRREWAVKFGTTLNYLNNLCQHPEQAGKKMIQRINIETGGLVTFEDMAANAGAQISRKSHPPR